MINVLLDVDTLGQIRSLAEQRGIHRVVRHLVYGLAGSGDCNVRLCAPHLRSRAIRNCENDPVLASLPFLDRRLRTLLHEAAYRQTVAIESRSGRQIARKVMRRACTMLAADLADRIGIIPPSALEAIDIYHSGFHAFPAQVMKRGKIQKFMTVYDLIPLQYAPYRTTRFGADWKHFEEAIASLTPDTWGFCISEATRNDLCSHTGLDPARFFITPLAAEPSIFYPCSDKEKREAIRKRYRLGENPYLLTLSAVDPHKNMDQVVHSFGKVIAQEPDCTLNLVIAGKQGSGLENIRKAMASSGVPEARVIFTGFVPEEDLAALYSGAMLFAHLSFLEGFGLTPLEAMQCGVPVITSNTSSLPEVVGDAGILVDPTDSDTLCQAIVDLYQHADLRAAMSKKSLARAQLFHWDRFTEATLAGYRHALAQAER